MGRTTALQAELRAALFAGADTSTIRAAIAQAEAEAQAEAQRHADLAAEREAADAERVRQSANIIAAAAAERIATTMAGLEPPPAPPGVV